MKLEINDSLASVLMTVIICAAIVGTILGVGFMIHESNMKTNQAIANAKTCEEAVLLQGGGTEVTNHLIACKIQAQPQVPVNQSGK